MPGRAAGAAAVLAAAALWGSTGTVAHFAPAGASPVSVGAARIVLGGALGLALAILVMPGGARQRVPAGASGPPGASPAPGRRPLTPQ